MEYFEKESENRALDALLAAAFRLPLTDETTSEDEAEKIAVNPPELSPEDEKAISTLGPNFVKELPERAARPRERRIESNFENEIKEAYAAMNRGNIDENLSEKTRQEIERKRRELLGNEYEQGKLNES
jgi:hypothetical protein